MKAFLQKHRRKIKWILLCVLASFLVLAWLAYIASIHAAQIFNREMARQHFFDGTITVERLTATPLGHVRFENLEWKGSHDGNRVFIPRGSFQVKPMDIVLRKISTRTIQELELNEAEIDLTFTEHMHIRGIQAAELSQPAARKGEIRHQAEKRGCPGETESLPDDRTLQTADPYLPGCECGSSLQQQ